MKKMYNKDGEECICAPDQIENMKAIGYIYETKPKTKKVEKKVEAEKVASKPVQKKAPAKQKIKKPYDELIL